MDKAEFLAKIQEIGTCEDEAARRTMLTDLQDGITNVFDQNEQLVEDNQKQKDDINRLYDENMKLFLRVGSEHKPEDKPEPEPEPKLSFENLFNEKGEIK